MDKEEFESLRKGDYIKHELERSSCVAVAVVQAGVNRQVVVQQTHVVTRPEEWELCRKANYK